MKSGETKSPLDLSTALGKYVNMFKIKNYIT